jgi:hypothetical protein
MFTGPSLCPLKGGVATARDNRAVSSRRIGPWPDPRRLAAARRPPPARGSSRVGRGGAAPSGRPGGSPAGGNSRRPRCDRRGGLRGSRHEADQLGDADADDRTGRLVGSWVRAPAPPAPSSARIADAHTHGFLPPQRPQHPPHEFPPAGTCGEPLRRWGVFLAGGRRRRGSAPHRPYHRPVQHPRQFDHIKGFGKVFVEPQEADLFLFDGRRDRDGTRRPT